MGPVALKQTPNQSKIMLAISFKQGLGPKQTSWFSIEFLYNMVSFQLSNSVLSSISTSFWLDCILFDRGKNWGEANKTFYFLELLHLAVFKNPFHFLISGNFLKVGQEGQGSLVIVLCGLNSSLSQDFVGDGRSRRRRRLGCQGISVHLVMMTIMIIITRMITPGDRQVRSLQCKQTKKPPSLVLLLSIVLFLHGE